MAGDRKTFDLVIVGGGIAGCALGRAMAQSGAEVLILEKEPRYRDRIRGEAIMPWGGLEAKALGLYDILLSSCGLEVPYETFVVAGEFTTPRHYPSSTPGKTGILSFFHPEMQDVMVRAASDAGAEIWRGASVRAISPGEQGTIEVMSEGAVSTVSARLIVGADGRESTVATKFGFKRQKPMQGLFTVGFQLYCDLPLEPALYFFLHGESGRGIILFEIKPGNYRAYLSHHKDALERRLSGKRDYQVALRHFGEIGMPAAWLEQITPHGILASFDGAFTWIDHPAQGNCALIGDAASTTDPVWGNGLSRTLRDVRLLRDRLLNDSNWLSAAGAYAEDHDDYYRRLRAAEELSNTIFFAMGRDAEARRHRIFALMEQEPETNLDLAGLGPESRYSDELAARLLTL